MLQFSTQNKIRINLCWNFPHKTKFQPMLQFSTQNKIRINLCWTFFYKKKFGSSYIAIVLTKQNSDQPILQFSTQNKMRINLCWIFFYKKRKKFGSSYIAIVLTEQNSDQPMLQFSTQNKIRINLCCNFPHKTKFGSTYVGLFLHKTKFGSTYVAIFLTKQNSDQPMLDFSTQNKIRINLCCNFPHKTKFEKRALVCEDLFQPRLVSTFLIILGSQDRTPFSRSNNG